MFMKESIPFDRAWYTLSMGKKRDKRRRRQKKAKNSARRRSDESIKVRKPIAPPSIRHSSKRDYKRIRIDIDKDDISSL